MKKQNYLSFFIFAAVAASPTSSFSENQGLLSNATFSVLCQVEVSKGKMDINQLSADESFAKGLCEGYILGFNYTSGSYVSSVTKLGATQGQIDFLKSNLYCPPPGGTFYDMAKVYIDYLSRHPEEANGDANATVMNAFHEAYPCK